MCIRDRAHTALHSTQLPLCCLTKPAALCSWQCHHLVCCCQSLTAAAIESATEDISPDDARNPSNGTAQAGTHCVAFHAVAALLPHKTSCSLQLAVPPLSCCCQSLTAAAIESATEDISPDDARNPSNDTAQAGAHYVALHAVAALPVSYTHLTLPTICSV